MKTTLNQTGKIYIISIFFISVFSAYAENPDFIRLSGSASEIGNIWGMVNARAIKEDMDRYYLSKASEKGITAEELFINKIKYKNHSESGENPFDLWNRKQSELIIKILQKLQN